MPQPGVTNQSGYHPYPAVGAFPPYPSNNFGYSPFSTSGGSSQAAHSSTGPGYPPYMQNFPQMPTATNYTNPYVNIVTNMYIEALFYEFFIF